MLATALRPVSSRHIRPGGLVGGAAGRGTGRRVADGHGLAAGDVVDGADPLLGAAAVPVHGPQHAEPHEQADERLAGGLRLPRVHEGVEQEGRHGEQEGALEEQQQPRLGAHHHKHDKHYVERRPA